MIKIRTCETVKPRFPPTREEMGNKRDPVGWSGLGKRFKKGLSLLRLGNHPDNSEHPRGSPDQRKNRPHDDSDPGMNAPLDRRVRGAFAQAHDSQHQRGNRQKQPDARQEGEESQIVCEECG